MMNGCINRPRMKVFRRVNSAESGFNDMLIAFNEMTELALNEIDHLRSRKTLLDQELNSGIFRGGRFSKFQATARS
jgi:hypothetical protein